MNRKVMLGTLALVIIIVLVGLVFVIINANAPLPDAPTGLKAVGNISSVSLSWTAPSTSGSEITGFKIYRSVIEGISANPIIMIVTSNHTIDTGLFPGQYQYAVSALCDNGESPLSENVSVIVTGYTPSANFAYAITSPGNYTFTCLTVSRYDIPVNALIFNMTQDGRSLHVSTITNEGEYLFPGATFTVGWMEHYTSCVFLVINKWTGGSVWGISGVNPIW